MSETVVSTLLDALLDTLAADDGRRARLVEVLASDAAATAGFDAAGWLDTKAAADYLGLTRDALHKLTARRAVPFSQEVAGGKLYFRRAELDRWRLERAHETR